jgi:hypothetical protein
MIEQEPSTSESLFKRSNLKNQMTPRSRSMHSSTRTQNNNNDNDYFTDEKFLSGTIKLIKHYSSKDRTFIQRDANNNNLPKFPGIGQHIFEIIGK